jgi:hypothetical protein
MRAAFIESTNLEEKRVSDIGQRRQGSIARFRISLCMDRLNANLVGARFEIRPQAAKSGDKFIFPLFYGTDGDSYFVVAFEGRRARTPRMVP